MEPGGRGQGLLGHPGRLPPAADHGPEQLRQRMHGTPRGKCRYSTASDTDGLQTAVYHTIVFVAAGGSRGRGRAATAAPGGRGMGRRRRDRHRYGPRGEYLGHTSDDGPLAKLLRTVGGAVALVVAVAALRSCQ